MVALGIVIRFGTGKKRAGGYNKKARIEECYNDAEDIEEKYVDEKKRRIELYQYIVHGRAPSEWAKCFDGIVSAINKPPTHSRH